MKFQQKPHKKTEDKKSYITKIREEEQKKRDRYKKVLRIEPLCNSVWGREFFDFFY